jgi:hypothetical protein
MYRALGRLEMFKKLQVVAALLSLLSYTAAGTVSIGTASARGDIRVDNNAVKGNATLFDGSVVETGQATADLRLDKGAEITMSTSSRGTLYRDRIVLQQGESELAAHSSFQVEANGLRVTPNQPDSRGVVSLRKGNTVEVAALNGSFGVTNDRGILLANVHPGRAMSFAIKTSESPSSFQGVGLVSYENGHYYLSTDSDSKYELTCKDFKKYVDTKVVVSGNLSSAIAQAAGGAPPALCVSSIAINGASTTPWLLIGGVLVGAGAGIGIGVYEANKSTPAASR